MVAATIAAFRPRLRAEARSCRDAAVCRKHKNGHLTTDRMNLQGATDDSTRRWNPGFTPSLISESPQGLAIDANETLSLLIGIVGVPSGEHLGGNKMDVWYCAGRRSPTHVHSNYVHTPAFSVLGLECSAGADCRGFVRCDVRQRELHFGRRSLHLLFFRLRADR